jgi:hypothetical protein
MSLNKDVCNRGLLGIQFSFHYELEVTNQKHVGKKNNNTFQNVGNNLQQTINPSRQMHEDNNNLP